MVTPPIIRPGRSNTGAGQNGPGFSLVLLYYYSLSLQKVVEKSSERIIIFLSGEINVIKRDWRLCPG
jgi:hypothetical protein